MEIIVDEFRNYVQSLVDKSKDNYSIDLLSKATKRATELLNANIFKKQELEPQLMKVIWDVLKAANSAQ